MFETGFLIASMLWSTVGAGFALYGKKAASAPALVCGMSLIGISFFIVSPWVLSLVSVAIITAAWYAKRMGY